MSADLFDMAIICKDAAKTYMENTEGFEIAFDCMKNSDVFITSKANPKTIGMVQARDYQEDLIKEKFGQDIEVETIIGTALPYALENGQVDGIIIDYMKSLHMKGNKTSTVIDGNDYTSYVLLVSKEFKETNEFKRFVKDYNNALRDLKEEEEKLKKQFFDYTKVKLEEGGLDKWKIKLLYLEDNQDTER